ncbi:MAG: flagellar motor switch protein FliN [Thermoleophilaceae bacterium]|nr:flagellar motor switch protein FliN [Thermoleophilaceae bacterium]MEA2471777.1 flagellar motor switch protein FliN [Thermoleophilaceae bacterium]
MHDEIEFMPLQPSPGIGSDGADLRRLHDVPVELAVEIGRTRMTIGQTLDLRPGSVVSLNRLAGEPVDLLINGKPIARGEVVVIDEEFGLRVTDVVSSGRSIEDEAETAAAAAARAEADLYASMAGAGESQPDPLPDPFAGASVDDLPMGGLPTPGT